MKKVIVTTTINPPTKAIERFESMEDWELVVIGDKKTPADYRLKRGIYVTPDEQEKYDPALSDAIGWNCIQRRNFGLLWAHDMGADVVAVVDDDNIPLDGWGQNLLVGRKVGGELLRDRPAGLRSRRAPRITGISGIVAIRCNCSPSATTAARPGATVTRRHPGRFLERRPGYRRHLPHGACARMRIRPRRLSLRLQQDCRRSIRKTRSSAAKCLRDYFLFPHVGRMDDIWAAYYLQAKGYRVVFNKASVYQERNAHDLVRDMRQEYLGYENNLNLVQDLARDPESIAAYLPGRSVWAFELYRRHFDHA